LPDKAVRLTALSAAATLVAALWPAVLLAAKDDIYMYRASNGVPYFSDTRPLNGGYTYIKTFQGRPTAVASCAGVTPAILESRAANYSALIGDTARDYGVDPGLVKAVMRVESCFDKKAVSRVGAQGLMQLMPGTAFELGVKDSFDPAQNIRGGVEYLSRMLTRFDNNHELALAAYNAGPEAVKSYGRIPPYPETQSYVRRVLKNYQTYRAAR
jgi:soluble lytic murein transglycosylase-like protein